MEHNRGDAKKLLQILSNSFFVKGSLFCTAL